MVPYILRTFPSIIRLGKALRWDEQHCASNTEYITSLRFCCAFHWLGTTRRSLHPFAVNFSPPTSKAMIDFPAFLHASILLVCAPRTAGRIAELSRLANSIKYSRLCRRRQLRLTAGIMRRVCVQIGYRSSLCSTNAHKNALAFLGTGTLWGILSCGSSSVSWLMMPWSSMNMRFGKDDSAGES